MRNAGIVPSPITYGCLVDACVNHNPPDMDKAMHLFSDMEQHKLKWQEAAGGQAGRATSQTIVYTTLIKGFAKAKQVSRSLVPGKGS